MDAGWCARTVRAAVFAAVCVLLAALGHVMMSGGSVPWWALGAGSVATGAAGWVLAGRERGWALITSLVVAAQTMLHWVFTFAQSAGQPTDATSTGSMGHDMGGMDAASMSLHSMPVHSMPVNSMCGTPSLGMSGAHLAAAVLCGLWLGYGERVTYRLLRAVAGWLAAPLRPMFARPALPRRPRVLTRRSRSSRVPRRLHLSHAITSRGPPARAAVV
ncbi:hypothetical protein KEF29_34510 [Streptomyces tuirus]|uniref:Integral membrane protein n=1 Tax=Streptomyces tuirus TaxID=68278 RepID=A0A941FJN9_9ACTN|nr:hypothetical protein [Streptomyces tuirus]